MEAEQPRFAGLGADRHRYLRLYPKAAGEVRCQPSLVVLELHWAASLHYRLDRTAVEGDLKLKGMGSGVAGPGSLHESTARTHNPGPVAVESGNRGVEHAFHHLLKIRSTLSSRG